MAPLTGVEELNMQKWIIGAIVIIKMQPRNATFAPAKARYANVVALEAKIDIAD